MSVLTDLETARERIAARISEYSLALAADAASPQPTYSIDGESIDRNGWRKSLTDQMSALTEQLTQINQAINAIDPYIVSTVVRL